jgi:hypothetical protein
VKNKYWSMDKERERLILFTELVYLMESFDTAPLPMEVVQQQQQQQPMQLEGLALPLWYPSAKYDYDALRIAATERTPEQNARLLLYPPPQIPRAVCAYLDTEANKHAAHAAFVDAGETVAHVEATIARAQTQAMETGEASNATVATVSVVPRIGKRCVCEQLTRDLVANGVAEAAVVAERVVRRALVRRCTDDTVAPRARLVRYHKQRRRRAGPRATAQRIPSLRRLRAALRPGNEEETQACARAASVCDALLAVAQCRRGRHRSDELRLRAEAKTLEPTVMAWLRTLDGGKLELSDGSLSVRTTRARAGGGFQFAATARGGINDAALLRLTAALFSDGQPVELIRAAQAGMRRLGQL